jgi:hypothetical protein
LELALNIVLSLVSRTGEGGVEEHEYIYGFIVLVSCSNFKVQRIKVNLMHVIVFGAMTILC